MVIIIITAFILFGCFARTVIGGKEISKLPVLAAEDCFFNNSLRFSYMRPRFDPSLYQFHVPFQLYAGEQMKQLRLPLWNPCFGCGFPTVAELQYCTFSPLRGIFQATHPYLYNLGIAVKCLIAALSMFLLSRLFTYSTGAAAFAAIAYGLCPFVMRELELPNEVELFPLIASAFLYFANGKGFIKAALLGACTSLALASMHPEFFFLSILNSLFLLLCARSLSGHISIIQTGKNLLVAGAIGVSLGAPLLLPFFELACNADSYKFHQFFVQKVYFQTLLTGLITPVNGGGSAFLGVVSLLMAAYAITTRFNKSKALSILVLALGLWCTLPGPLEGLEKVKFLAVIPPRYLLAPFLLSLTLLAAMGVDACAEDVKEKRGMTLLLAAPIAAVLAITPFLMHGVILPGYDGTLPVPQLHKEEAIKGAVSLAVSCLAMTAAYFFKLPQKSMILLPAFLLAANFFSLSGPCKTALGPTFAFSFPSTEVLDRIKKSGERMTAAGQHFFFPNVALAYDLRDFRQTGPLVPKWTSALGILSRSSEPGGKGRGQQGDTFLSKTIDAGSVKYVISRWPCYSKADQPLPEKPFAIFAGGPAGITESMTLKDGRYCLSSNGEFFATFDWQVDPVSAAHIASELDIVDGQGKLLAQGTRLAVAKQGASQVTKKLSIRIPDFSKRKDDVYVILRLYSALSESIIPISKSSVPVREQGVELLKVSPEETGFTDLTGARLKFISADSNQVLLYENTGALPQAYLATKIVSADSFMQAVKEMSKPDFDAHSKTIIEATREQTQLPFSNDEIVPAQVQRPDAHTVLIETDCSRDAFLILTDTFYNGWRATLDGKEVPILRANVNFRAVRVGAGRHQIKFEFYPHTFYIGLAIALLTVLVGAILSFKELAKSR